MTMKNKNIGDELIESLTQARDLLRAGRTTQLSRRLVKQVPPPQHYTSAAVQEVRTKLNVSQAVFAEILGVSTVLVQAWEQGKRQPSHLACRLLDVISRDLATWRRFANAA